MNTPKTKLHKKLASKKTEQTKIPLPPGPEAPCEEIDAYFSKYSWSDLERAGHMRPLTKKEKAEHDRFTETLKQQIKARRSKVS